MRKTLHTFLFSYVKVCVQVFLRVCVRDLSSFSHKFISDSKKIGSALNLALSDLIVTMVMSTQTAATSMIKVLLFIFF